jgi:DNA-binding response OmpR family regulator
MRAKKILIVDDEQDILDVLEKKLKENGYDTLALSGGNEVLDKCKSFQPDLIILDIVLADIDGYSQAVSLRKDKSLENIPIIFMTAKELEYSGIEKRLIELDNCGFINKPCSFQDLLEKIKAIIG